ncbi:ribosomal-protein-alanine N-acetyltransferase [Aquimixticola soesokkakensis]|uniref:Ribosomal-protein-alanine N-acetyltransferase n=1 Tax=Aquimixticola soesokkakensis TaxID=1519096 RepID=A0A1Y5T323_9RHOB|nr:GNAT family N-acetyltransferase [Aquimixticola soesokkakensis]SLN53062.1 ribosomal-protein-alanine N-acetyltransferase [Aquimixticola soesokkakensis]
MQPAALAALHAVCFTTPRPWSETEFSGMLALKGVFLHCAAQGFVMGRVIGDEAELLTIAVHPEARLRGQGRALLGAFEDQARTQAASKAFLEVADDNTPARALYETNGWSESGKRRRYYRHLDGRFSDALLLTKPLK